MHNCIVASQIYHNDQFEVCLIQVLRSSLPFLILYSIAASGMSPFGLKCLFTSILTLTMEPERPVTFFPLTILGYVGARISTTTAASLHRPLRKLLAYTGKARHHSAPAVRR